MAYIIGQYNHNYASGDDDGFITPITSGEVKRRETDIDKGVIGGIIAPFNDECIKIADGGGFQGGVTYYFRGQIKRMTDSQIFNIKLVNYDRPETGNGVEQFIKQIVVQGGSYEHEWVSVEIIFTPLEGLTFDTLLFELQRNINDYRVMIRYPLIAYQQLGIINNKIEDMAGNGVQRLLKIGVQSHPGLMMCVNREEIHMSRTGIFEIRNGVLPVDFFSVVNAAIEVGTAVDDWKAERDNEVINIEQTYSDPADKEREYEKLHSECFFGTNKQYKIDAFTLDYMYNKNT